MLTRRTVVLGALGAALAACTPSKFRSYNGPEVTRIDVFKDARLLRLMHNEQQLLGAEFELGFQPVGHKEVEGDGKTPIGKYIIDRKNPNSRYHLSIGISYPDNEDRARAWARGMSPGGDIFIHGTPKEYVGQDDWTWGCIAVDNLIMEEIYAMVNVGTPIWLYP